MSSRTNGGQGPDERDWVATLLDQTDAVEPPATLVQDVMARIRQAGARKATGRKRDALSGGGRTMTKNVLLALAAAAVVMIGVMLFTGYPPVGHGTEGTIGAARRYQAEQITTKDVKLQNPEIQTLLQSDAWARVTRDKAAWNALTNKDVQRLFTAPGVQTLLSDPAMKEIMSIPAVQNALAAPGAVAALSSQSVQHALSSQSVQSLLQAHNVTAAMLSSEMQEVLSTPALQLALGNPAFMSALNNQAFSLMLANPSFYAVLATPAVQSALANPAFMNALNSQAFMFALNNQAFMLVLSSQSMLHQALTASEALNASALHQ